MEASKIIESGKRALRIEISALNDAVKNIGDSFAQSIMKIADCSGKLIVVGIGKSAHVGNKIVATLNSTGTPSQFLHAAEAIHGDLGVLQKNDIVLCISNSGNSPEIVALAPFLKKYSSGLIAMTGNEQSKLALMADIVINSRVTLEACPNNLAPTSSTTVQMALGDAMAVALMELNAFRDVDFAKYHPGGSLGKKLTTTVAQLMSQNKPQISEDAPLKEIILSISGSKHGVTVVTDAEDVVGVITDGDLRRMLMKEVNLHEIFARDIMTIFPKTVSPDVLAKEALEIMKEHNIGQLVVTQDNQYIGIIDLHRILDEGI